MVARGHTDKSIRRLENFNTRNLPEVLGLGTAVDFIGKIGQGAEVEGEKLPFESHSAMWSNGACCR